MTAALTTAPAAPPDTVHGNGFGSVVAGVVTSCLGAVGVWVEPTRVCGTSMTTNSNTADDAQPGTGGLRSAPSAHVGHRTSARRQALAPHWLSQIFLVINAHAAERPNARVVRTGSVVGDREDGQRQCLRPGAGPDPAGRFGAAAWGARRGSDVQSGKRRLVE